jgi:endo-1,4-beta-xylanase
MAARANTRGKGPIPYGAAVRTDPLYDDPAYQKAILDYCQVIVGEGGLKWIDLRPDRHIFDFTQPDRQLAFAEAHGLEMRGHTLAWHGAMPDWTETIASAEEARDELVSHIHTVVGRYKGRIPSWDVCNEPIADTPTRDAPLRDSMWHRNLGRDYIELALRTTAAADPDARLVINEYNFEQATDESRARRKAFLDLLRDLKARGAPLHAVGIQGHIRSDTALDRSGLTAFIAEIDAMGLGVLVTELDVIDKSLPGQKSNATRPLPRSPRNSLMPSVRPAGRRPCSPGASAIVSPGCPSGSPAMTVCPIGRCRSMRIISPSR